MSSYYKTSAVAVNLPYHDDVIKWKHFRVAGPLCGKFTGPGDFPTQRPVTRSFDVFFDLRPNKRSSKQSWGWWFGTLSCSLWPHCNMNRAALNCSVVRQSAWWVLGGQTDNPTDKQGESSQLDNFIVVSLTTLEAIKWGQDFCCDGCGAVHKTNTWSKVDGLYCDKTNYTMYMWPSLASETLVSKQNHH